MPADKAVVVIGGGFAGLRAAVALADAGVPVTVLESRVGLGGRARSFTDPASGEVVDNGQHLFLAGYDRTLAFLERLGTRDRLLFQDHLRVGFVEPGGRTAVLDCPPVPAPWHLFLGMSRLPGFGWRERLGWWALSNSVRRTSGASGTSYRGETVEEWLERMGQGSRSRSRFWNPLAVAVLNEDPSRASVAGLQQVLSRMMFRPRGCSRLGMASVGLSDLYTEQARGIIESRGGRVLLNRPAAGIVFEGGRVTGVTFPDGTRVEAAAVVSAVPPSVLLRLLPEGAREAAGLREILARFHSSPIVSVNLWLDRPVCEEAFVALLGTRFQWLFNKAGILRASREEASYISLILSAAHEEVGMSNEALIQSALEDLRRCFPAAAGAELVRAQVVREREATVSLTPEAEALRPGSTTPIRNLFLAGDWTATGLPATIESAVVSGEEAAAAALKWLASPTGGQ